MLSLFPYLLSYTFFVPFILRLAVAGILLWATYPLVFTRDISLRERVMAITISLPAVLLAIGLWTQAAALIVAVAIALDALSPRHVPIIHAFDTRTRALLTIIAFTLVLSGAGAYAIDLPL